MNRKRFVLPGVFVVVALLLLALTLSLSLGSRNTPPFATVEAIEQSHELQIDRLLELAKDKQLVDRAVFNDPEDVVLFGDSDILEAKVEPSNHLLGSKEYIFKSRFSVLPRQASIDSAVVNRHWDTHADGSKLTVLEYRRRTRDDEGREASVTLLLDLPALEKKAAQPAPDK